MILLFGTRCRRREGTEQTGEQAHIVSSNAGRWVLFMDVLNRLGC